MRIIGLDFGYGYTKGLSADRRVLFRSIVSPAELIRFESDMRRDNGSAIKVQVGGRWRFVGEYACLQSSSAAQTLDPARTGSDEHRALFYAAASELLQINDTEIAVVSGLPVADFDEHNKNLLRDMLNGEHVVDREGKKPRRFTVKGCYLVPQAMGAFFSLIIDGKGQIVDGDLATGRVAIIDIGTLTTNFVLVDQLRYIETGSSSIQAGVAEVLIKIAKDLKRDYGLNWTLHLDRVDEAVRARSIELYGKSVTISKLVDRYAHDLAETIVARARSLWGAGADLRIVLIAGGGAHLLSPHLSDAYRHTKVVNNPQWANCIGYLHAGLRRFGQ